MNGALERRVSVAEIDKPTRFGPDWPGRRCGAKTRAGTPCKKAAMKGRGGAATMAARALDHGPRPDALGSRRRSLNTGD